MGSFFTKLFGKFNSKPSSSQQKQQNREHARRISRYSIAQEPADIPAFKDMWSGKKNGKTWGPSFAEAIHQFMQEQFSPEVYHFLMAMEKLHKVYAENLKNVANHKTIRAEMTNVYKTYVQTTDENLVNLAFRIRNRFKKLFVSGWKDLDLSMKQFIVAEDKMSFDVGNLFNRGGFQDSVVGKKWLKSKNGILATQSGLNVKFAHTDYVNELVSNDNVGYLDYDNEYNNEYNGYNEYNNLKASYSDGYSDGYNEYNGYNGYNQIQGVDVLFYVLLVICVIIGLIVCSIIGCVIGWIVRGIYGKKLIKNQEDDLDQYQV